ncbi:MAG TPA: hypothetical protein VM689_13460 [Aliidongia sp.]|nr:hypothetical protein [Aliidongia sp.]
MSNRLWQAALAPACLVASVAPACAATVDVSGVVTSVSGVALAAFGVVVSWAAHRAVSVLERWSGSQLQDLHGTAIDDAVQLATSYVQAKLAAVADPAAKLQIRDQVIAEAAQMVALQVPNALDALGLTPDGVAAKLKMMLGLAEPPAPVAPASAPTGSIAGTVAAGLALALATLPLVGCLGSTPSATDTASGTAAGSTTAAAPSADQQAFDNACWTADALDAAFKIAEATGKIPDGLVTTEQDAKAGVDALCAGPAPTDLKDAVSKIEAAGVQIAAQIASQ